ncbi:uncharacterized protein LOC117169370 [Belonocnema kinseyi]|uniref:uncharacterized protein LOC117169370 n=1 Tax=Belonocnema kinseyi TaxID=2817044 RepID=UPI00143CFB2B|nr:uncharacterized protein LOC117169370 [Belonocnema kinseyi]
MLDLQLQDPLDGGHPVSHPVKNCPTLPSSRSFVNLRLSSERYRNKFNRKLKIDEMLYKNHEIRKKVSTKHCCEGGSWKNPWYFQWHFHSKRGSRCRKTGKRAF